MGRPKKDPWKSEAYTTIAFALVEESLQSEKDNFSSKSPENGQHFGLIERQILTKLKEFERKNRKGKLISQPAIHQFLQKMTQFKMIKKHGRKYYLNNDLFFGKFISRLLENISGEYSASLSATSYFSNLDKEESFYNELQKKVYSSDKQSNIDRFRENRYIRMMFFACLLEASKNRYYYNKSLFEIFDNIQSGIVGGLGGAIFLEFSRPLLCESSKNTKQKIEKMILIQFLDELKNYDVVKSRAMDFFPVSRSIMKAIQSK